MKHSLVLGVVSASAFTVGTGIAIAKDRDYGIGRAAPVTRTVTVAPVPPKFETTLPSGEKAMIGGDLAYEIKVDFGSVEITNALGLKPSTKFYIDTTNHVYKVVVADVGDPTTPPAVFLK